MNTVRTATVDIMTCAAARRLHKGINVSIKVTRLMMKHLQETVDSPDNRAYNDVWNEYNDARQTS